MGSIVVGFGLGERAGRGALRLLKRPARFCRGPISQRGMQPDIVVIVAPEGQQAAGIGQTVEDLLVEAFVAQASVERLDVAVLLRFTGIDVVPFDIILVGAFQDRLSGELGATVRDDAGGFAIDPDQRIQFPRDPGPGAAQARTRLAAEKRAIKRQLEGLYDAIAEGLRSPGLKEKLLELEGRVEAIDAALTTPAPAPVRSNPNLSELYRRKVTELAITLADPAIAQPAREVIRGLIERVAVRWEGGQAVVVLDGALTALVGLAQNAKVPASAGPFGGLSNSSVKVVAGARNRCNLPRVRCYI